MDGWNGAYITRHGGISRKYSTVLHIHSILYVRETANHNFLRKLGNNSLIILMFGIDFSAVFI